MPYENLAELTDEELIQRVKNGSETALETIIDRYQKPLYNFIVRMINNCQIAEDILQDVFLKTVKAIPKYKIIPYKFKSFIFTIANNTTIDHIRRNKKGVLSLDQPINIYADDNKPLEIKDVLSDTQTLSPEQFIDQQYLKEKISNAIMMLTHDQKQVFILHEYSGLKFIEIADMLNCSLNTVLGRMHYAIKKLQKILKEY